MREENIIDSLNQQERIENPALKEKRESLKKNTETYTVKGGDTIASIAAKMGISNYLDLLALNRLLWKDIVTKGKNETRVIIRAGDELFVPKDKEQFQKDIEGIRRISEAIVKNERVAKGDRKALKKEINERLFPSTPESVGTAKLLRGFIKAQEATIDPLLPRIVDVAHQKNVSCANLVRTLLAQWLNPKDLSPAELKFFRKQNLDAWMLPEEFKQIGYEQKFNLMGNFDSQKVGSENPLNSEKEKEYTQGNIELGKYLEEKGVPGSLLPIYYRYSSYKGVVSAFNSGKKEKHYNTHQSLYAGNGTMQFDAYEVGEVKNGQVIPFGNDKERIKKDISRAERDLAKEKSSYEKQKEALKEIIKLENNPDLLKKINGSDKVIQTYVSYSSKDKQSALLKAIEDESSAAILAAKPSATTGDIEYLLALQARKRRIQNELKRLSDVVNDKKVEEFSELSTTDYGAILSNSKGVKEAISRLNTSVATIKKAEESLNSEKKRLEKITLELEGKSEEYKLAQTKFAENTEKLAKAKEEYKTARTSLLEAIDTTKNTDLANKLTFLNRRVLVLAWGNEERAKAFLQAIKVNDTATLTTRFHQSEEDCDHLRRLYSSQQKAESSISSIRRELGEGKTGLSPIQANALGQLLSGDHAIIKALGEYNSHVNQINGLGDTLDSLQAKLKIKKETSAIDYLANFLQQRGDLGSSMMTQAGRDRMIEGMQKYASLINLKVNGTPVDFTAEFAKKKQDRLKITETDKIEISGPMMIDGVHMVNSSDIDRRQNMNSRTRFFFEFAASGVLLPTELLEPKEGTTFRKEAFGRITDKLAIKGTFDLRRGMTLEKALKKQIPIFEKEAFAKLDPEAKDYQEQYDALVQKFYALQINALQMMGIIEHEARLNPLGTNINRPIPYYDTANIAPIFQEYIVTAKAKKLAHSKEVAPFIEYMDVQLFPGDTYANVFGRIVKSMEGYSVHFEKYPNLQYISKLNDTLKKEFLKQYIESAITTEDIDKKTKKSKVTWENLLSGKIRPGTKFILHLAKADEIIGNLRSLSYRESVDPSLHGVDKDIIDVVVPVQQNRDLVKTSMILESYERSNDKWYKPDGLRRFAKQKLEEYPFLQHIKSLNSFGDFQIRIKGLRNGWNEEWPRQEHLEDALATLRSAKVKQYLAEHTKEHPETAKTIIKDQAIVEKIELLLTKKPLEKEDFAVLTNNLLELIRLDDWSGANIIGKTIWAVLLDNKLNSHSKKLSGVLEKSGEDMELLRKDGKKMRSYEQSILLINNLGEKKVLFGLTENYILRLLEKGNILSRNGKSLTSPEIQTSFLSGSLEYGFGTFVKHIQNLTNPLVGSDKYFKEKGTIEELTILTALLSFNVKVEEAMTKPKKEQESLVVKAIFELLSDKKLRTTLESMPDPKNPETWVSSSLLPTTDELKGNEFRNTFFNYIRKGEDVTTQAKSKEDTLAASKKSTNS